MKLVEINWHPTQKQLRQFSIIGAVLLPVIGWLWGADGYVLKCLAGAGLLIAVTGYAFPAVVKPIFLLLTLVTIPIGLVVGELAMLLIYFGVFLPIGLFFRRWDGTHFSEDLIPVSIHIGKRRINRATSPAIFASRSAVPNSSVRPEKDVNSMAKDNSSQSDSKKSEFVQANKEKPLNLVQEFMLFVMENKKWWLIPILVVFALVGLLVMLGSSGAAPFIYTLF